MKQRGMAGNSRTIIVIGGGAAGFFTAIQIREQRPDTEVVILEKTAKLLSKVRISGGGRCNVTNACGQISAFARYYPRGEKFLQKAFHVFSNQDTIQWFAGRGVKLVAEPDGRMFPVTNTSQTIIDTFLDAAVRHHIRIYTQTAARSITPLDGGGYAVATDSGIMEAGAVVLATGGYPKEEMYAWLQPQPVAAHIVAPVPSLFSFNLPGNAIVDLRGLSVPDAKVKIAGTKLAAQGPLLITHWGLSGPAVLKLSAWGALLLEARQYRFEVIVNWLPEYNEESVNAYLTEAQMTFASRQVSNKNPFGLPSRLWQYFLAEAGVEEAVLWSHLKAKQRHLLARQLCNMTVQVSGKTTYKEEFVTAGGIDTAYVDVQTMEHKLMPGLYVVGEALNIDGITGGFNFQNAWTTSFIAARAIASKAPS